MQLVGSQNLLFSIGIGILRNNARFGHEIYGWINSIVLSNKKINRVRGETKDLKVPQDRYKNTVTVPEVRYFLDDCIEKSLSTNIWLSAELKIVKTEALNLQFDNSGKLGNFSDRGWAEGNSIIWKSKTEIECRRWGVANSISPAEKHQIRPDL